MKTTQILLSILILLTIAFFLMISAEAPDASAQGSNLLTNGDFSNGFTSWWTAGSVNVSATGGVMCATVNVGGGDVWSVIVGQTGLNIENGKTYSISFDAYTAPGSSTSNVTIEGNLQLNASPYTAYTVFNPNITPTSQSYSYTFVMSQPTDNNSAFQLRMGAVPTGSIICFDNIIVQEDNGGGPTPTPTITPTVDPSLNSQIRVNQVGYLPDAPKRASIVNANGGSVTWELIDNSNAVLTSGQTIVHGYDAASGDNIHIADFSAFTTPGTDLHIRVGSDSSYPFDIGSDIYDQMKYDALAYFYHNRSGIAITQPYAGGSQWTRAAGHINTPAGSPNKGDNGVSCDPSQNCGYTLDVRKGWYDAGDHGKYVVNGGISLWTMFNQYERSIHWGSNSTDFADGKLNIPENSNGVADILDEARWQMEFMLAMQAPSGSLQGMVHHKIADANWTGLPLAPADDPQTRYLYPPTTAATLNLAATAAQCARIWNSIDPTFATKCQTAAETAWAAAVAHPAIYATVNGNGSGAYGDNDVTDEFYWASAELYITTGSTTYSNYMTGTGAPYYKAINNTGGAAMNWQKTAALGNISLAIVPNNLGTGSIQDIRDNIATFASNRVNILNNQGYLVPMVNSDYVWGSNANVYNNMILMGLAYDFTGTQSYADGLSESMDYILGRNPMNQSYITGYGENPLQNPHHRFWANQANASYPSPPPGAASGGPNIGLEDPVASSNLAGCSPAKCFIDDIGSWSTNEITVNWNAPFAWAAAYLDELGNLAAPAAPLHLDIALGSNTTTNNLVWTTDPANHSYEVWRSTTPYFTPGNTNSSKLETLPLGDGDTTDPNGLGDSAKNHTYIIRALNATGSSFEDSNETGEFDFDIVPGS